MKSIRQVAVGAALLAMLGSAAVPSRAAEKVVLQAEVASSVTVPFQQFAKILEKKHPNYTYEGKFLGGQVIQADVEADKPIDLVIVGKNQTDKLTAHINPPVAILTNKEVILVPKGNPGKIKGLKDLGNPGVKVALGTADSAVGGLARGVIKKAVADPAYGADFAQKVRANTTVEATSGVGVVDAVASGKVDAAIAFVSDQEPLKYKAIAIPDSLNVESVYYVFIPKSAKNPKLAEDMVKLASSKQGQAILHTYHYAPPPKG